MTKAMRPGGETEKRLTLNADQTTLQLQKNTHQSDHLADKSCENVMPEMPSWKPCSVLPFASDRPIKKSGQEKKMQIINTTAVVSFEAQKHLSYVE